MTLCQKTLMGGMLMAHMAVAKHACHEEDTNTLQEASAWCWSYGLISARQC